MIGDSAFEKEFRATIERAYQRKAPADSPIARLLAGKLRREDARKIWTTKDQQSLLFFTQVTAPHLMAGCEDLDARIGLWNAIYLVFGRGRPNRSYPHYLQRFLAALGSAPSEEIDGVLHENEGIAYRRAAVLQMGFVEALISELLAPSTLGPYAYARIAEALSKSFNLDDAQLRFFHAQVEDKRTLDVSIGLVLRYSTTPEAQKLALSWLAAAFDRPPLASFAFGT